MKKIITTLSVFLVATLAASAQTLSKTSPNSYAGYLANETGLAYSNTFALDMASYDAAKVSAVVNYASTTFASKTFTDGAQSTGSVTVVSTVALSGVTLNIGGITVTAGTSFPVVNSLSDTAANLAQAINASTCPLSSILSAEAIGSVVYTTSTYVGGNYSMATSNSNKLSVSGANMTGGKGAYYSAADDTIQIAAHGFTTALPVLYTEGAAIGGLTDQTTYYVIPVDSGNIKLAATSTGAVAGLAVNITTQRAQTSANTYILAPLDMGASNASAKWQYSNDGTNYLDVPDVASILVSSATSSTFAGWDFGAYDYRYLRLNVTGPTQGGILLKAVMHVKK